MTPHHAGRDGFPAELLAAYADGELDPAEGAAVEGWLADHPEALDELNAQRAFSPGNAGLWERAEPPEPSADAWAAARRRIADALAPAAPAASGRWRVAGWVVAGLAAGLAAAAAWVALAPVAPPPDGDQPQPVEFARRLPGASEAGPSVAPAHRAAPPARRPDPLESLAVLTVATDDDVVLERVPDTRTGWLPVGRHPLPDVLVLAAFEDVELQEVDPSPAWPTGGPKMTTAPGDAPMIFAFRPR